MESIVAAAAEEEQVVANFEAILAVTVLETGGALETSKILFLELVGGGEDTLAFPLSFSLVIRVKATSFTSGILSYTSPLVWKLHPCSGVTFKTYKPTFHGSHLSHNMSYGSTATSRYSVFHSGDTPIQLGLL